MWIIWVPSNARTHQHLNIVLVPPRCLYVASFTLTFKERERERENDCAVIIWAKLEELVFDCSGSSAWRGFLGVGAQARLVSQPGANQLVWRNVGHPNSSVGYLGMWSLSLSLYSFVLQQILLQLVHHLFTIQSSEKKRKGRESEKLDFWTRVKRSFKSQLTRLSKEGKKEKGLYRKRMDKKTVLKVVQYQGVFHSSVCVKEDWKIEGRWKDL